MADNEPMIQGTQGGVANAAALIAGMQDSQEPPVEDQETSEATQEPQENIQAEGADVPEEEGDETLTEEAEIDEIEAADEIEADDDESEDDEPDTVHVEPPISWSEAEKAEFAELPPAVQRTVARRESEREAAFTTRSQEIAGDKAQLDEAVKVAGERWIGQLTLVDGLLEEAAEANGFTKEPDWQTLKQSMDPDVYRDLREEWNDRKSRFDGLLAKRQQIAQQAQVEAGERTQAYITAEQARTAAEWPAYKANPDEAMSPIRAYLRSEGVSDDNISQLIDADFIRVVRKAKAYDELQQKKPAVKKRVSKAKTVAKPGAAASRSRQKGERVRSAMTSAQQRPSVRSLASVFAELRKE